MKCEIYVCGHIACLDASLFILKCPFLIVEVNSSGEFIYSQIVNRNVNQTRTPDNYVKI